MTKSNDAGANGRYSSSATTQTPWFAAAIGVDRSQLTTSTPRAQHRRDDAAPTDLQRLAEPAGRVIEAIEQAVRGVLQDIGDLAHRSGRTVAVPADRPAVENLHRIAHAPSLPRGDGIAKGLGTRLGFRNSWGFR